MRAPTEKLNSVAFCANNEGTKPCFGAKAAPDESLTSFANKRVLFPMKTTTGPLCIWFTKIAPSVSLNITTGIVTVAPDAPGPGVITPGSLLIIITPTAPAFWAFNAFSPNSQPPEVGFVVPSPL